MPHDRQFYEPEGGLALDKDSNLFDVTLWRFFLMSFSESGAEVFGLVL